MKLNIIRTILICSLIGIFITIFGFSNQNSEKSGGMSQKVTNYIVKYIPQIQKMPKTEKEKAINIIEKVIRKIAHFSIYTIVGILLMGLMSTYKIKEINQISVSIIIGVIYAITDEIHQAFIPGRSAQITDVILDSMGVLTGIFLILLLLELIRKITKINYTNININLLK